MDPHHLTTPKTFRQSKMSEPSDESFVPKDEGKTVGDLLDHLFAQAKHNLSKDPEAKHLPPRSTEGKEAFNGNLEWLMRNHEENNPTDSRNSGAWKEVKRFTGDVGTGRKKTKQMTLSGSPYVNESAGRDGSGHPSLSDIGYGSRGLGSYERDAGKSFISMKPASANNPPSGTNKLRQFHDGSRNDVSGRIPAN